MTKRNLVPRAFSLFPPRLQAREKALGTRLDLTIPKCHLGLLIVFTVTQLKNKSNTK